MIKELSVEVYVFALPLFFAKFCFQDVARRRFSSHLNDYLLQKLLILLESCSVIVTTSLM